ncbi:PREDICTED: putative protein TPRXL [Nicotiana attenuata]|uniref:putative protein TPRXL n=1 Tax=Nicotiana attenuata TaxID=49451 RepID=UPI0009050C79|nr:PREDICTED: putative protein TPRXL [Nicotiana attenuata]
MAMEEEKESQMATPLENQKEAINSPTYQDIEQPKDTKLECSIIDSSTNPPLPSINIIPTPTLSSLNTPYAIQNAKDSFIPTKEEPSNSNSTPTQTFQHGKHSSASPSGTPSDNLCPTPSNARLSSYQLDGARPHGLCNILHGPNQRSRGNSNPPQHPISSKTHNGRNEISHEQLSKSSLAKHHHSSNGTIIKPSNSSGNERAMEHPTPVQPHKPSKCSRGPSLLPLGDVHPSQSHLSSLGHQPGEPRDSKPIGTPSSISTTSPGRPNTRYSRSRNGGRRCPPKP